MNTKIRSLFLSCWLIPALASAVSAQVEEDTYFSGMPVVASVSRLPQRLADAQARDMRHDRLLHGGSHLLRTGSNLLGDTGFDRG